MDHPAMTRFTPRTTAFSLFLLDKNTPRLRDTPCGERDEPYSHPPVWRLPQPIPTRTRTTLENSDLPVSHIAWNTGFTHLAGFNHLFKNRFGVAPGDYRKKHQKER